MPSTLLLIQKYLPAVVKQYRNGYGYFVEYYVENPESGELERRRLRCQRLAKRYRTNRERILAAQKIADELNRKLSGGWSPLHETTDSRLYTPISDMRDKFLRHKEAEGVRPATMVSYRSMTGMFLRWCEDTGRASRFSGTFLKRDAIEYMDYTMERGGSNRNYDNVLKMLKVFFSWGLENCYCRENPFSSIKPLPKEKKRRILVDAGTRASVDEYLKARHPQLRLFIHLIYTSAMRPKEISMIRLRDINIQDHYIRVPAENSKNKKERVATITGPIIEYLQTLLQSYTDGDLFLFGATVGSVPGKTKMRTARMRENWMAVRSELNLPNEMQLYSFRDTGLIDLLHAGVDQLTVQHHADHSSLDVQRIYTNHYDPGLVEKIYEKSPKF